MMRKKYCCICDTKIEEWKIDGQEEEICKKCSKITNGYYKEEKDFIKELRNWLNLSNHYEIEGILFVFRKFLKKKGIVL